MSLPRLHVTAVALAAILLASCNEAPQAQQAAAPQVTVARPLVKTIADWDHYVGQFEAVNHVELKPRVSGYLVEVAVTDGALVNAGDLLFRIDPRPFEAALAEARGRVGSVQSRLANARSERDRARGLLDILAVSQEEFDGLDAAVKSAEADLASAQASLRTAELNLEFTRITAPVAGRVSERRVDIGNTVKADETVLTTVVSVDPMHFSFQGSEAMYLRYLRQNPQGLVGAPVRISLQDEGGPAWEGSIDFFDNALNSAAGTIRGRAVVPNPDGFLVPGLYGQLELQASAAYQGILLPDSALSTRGAQRLAMVVNADDVVEARVVELGPLHDGLRVIRSGLDGSERVIINGLQRAFPGTPVAATETTIADPAQN
jgi:multidrug efflux system membrane fusion protein